MTIGIDGNEANVEEKVGVSVYTFELLQYFYANVSKDWNFVVYLREKPRQELPEQKDGFRYRIVKGPAMWRDVFLPTALFLGTRPDVFFSPAHYTPRFCPVPVVVTIHDLSHLHYPDDFLKKDLYKLTNWTKHALSQSKNIIAVSKHTKDDILKHYSVPEEKVEVVYNGFRKIKYQRSNIKNTNQNLKIEKPYLLYVGTLQPRKNVQTLIEALNLLQRDHSDLKLVIVGKKGWMYDKIFQKVKDLELESKVIFTGYLPDEEVALLYQQAAAFVLPSLYEGFGIPILEAMSHGCPVITSNTSSLPEIGGDACLYFDPHDTIELQKSIQKVLDNDTLRSKMIQKGKKRVQMFSWEKCATETLEVLKRVATIAH